MTEIKETIMDAEIAEKDGKEVYTPLDIAKTIGKFGCTLGTTRIVRTFCDTFGRRSGDNILMNASIGITSWFLADTVCDRVVETMDRKLDETAKAIVDLKEALKKSSEESTD